MNNSLELAVAKLQNIDHEIVSYIFRKMILTYLTNKIRIMRNYKLPDC